MARLGAFDPDLVPLEDFDRLGKRNGWFAPELVQSTDPLIFLGIGAVSGGSPLSLAIPPGHVGEFLVALVANRDQTSSPITPSGWILPTNGQGANAGGQIFATVFVRVADGTEGATLAVAFSGTPSATVGVIARYSKDPRTTWIYDCVNGADDVTGTAWSVTATAALDLKPGDLVLACSGVGGTDNRWSAEDLSETGITFGTFVERSDANVGGTNVNECLTEHAVLSGSANVAPVYTATLTLSAGSAGATVFLRLRQGWTLPADAASYTITAQNAGLKADRKLAAAGASYAVTAQAAGLKADRKIAAAAASYALSAQAASLHRGYVLAMGTGSYAVSAQAAALIHGYRLAALAASYIVTGQAAGLKAGRRLAAALATYIVSGQDATLRAGRRLAASGAVYVLSAQSAGLAAGRRLSASSASYSVSAQAAGLRAGRRLAADSASYLVTAQNAGLIYHPVGGATLVAGGAVYTVTAQDAGLQVVRRLPAGGASYAVSAQSVALRAARRLAAGSASYLVTGQDAALHHDLHMAAGGAVYLVTGQDVAFRATRGIRADGAVYLVTGGQVRFRLEPTIPDLIIPGPDLGAIIVAALDGSAIIVPALAAGPLVIAAPDGDVIIVPPIDDTPLGDTP